MNKNDSVAPNTETHKSDSMNDQVLVTKSGGLTKFEQTVITMLAASRIANPSADPRQLAETARADAQALFDVLNGVVPMKQETDGPLKLQPITQEQNSDQGASGADANVTEKES